MMQVCVNVCTRPWPVCSWPFWGLHTQLLPWFFFFLQISSVSKLVFQFPRLEAYDDRTPLARCGRSGPVRCFQTLVPVVGTSIRSVRIWHHFLAQSSAVSPAFSSTLYTLRFRLWSYCCWSFWSLRTLRVLCSCLRSCSFISAFSFSPRRYLSGDL